MTMLDSNVNIIYSFTNEKPSLIICAFTKKYEIKTLIHKYFNFKDKLNKLYGEPEYKYDFKWKNRKYEKNGTKYLKEIKEGSLEVSNKWHLANSILILSLNEQKNIISILIYEKY